MFAAVALFAALTAGGPPHMMASKTTAAPALDGRLDEAAWKLAPPSSAFTQKYPIDGAAPTETTTVRVLYDDDALYIGIDCPQRAPLAPRLTRRDRATESDWVSINLDTRGDGKSAVEFLVNASGVLVDGTRSNDVDYSADWDENWEAIARSGDRGWSAELRIPLRILRFARADVQSWGLQVRRYVSALQETDEWAYIPRSVAAEVSRYGRLEGLRGLEPSSVVELRPFVLGRLRTRTSPKVADRNTSVTVGGGTDATASGGLDLKWHATQDLTVDATFNPDFAQVEADQVVLNLSTFEIFKPEKRPFFLEGAELVAPRLGLPLVYTKRIGRAPDPPLLRRAEHLVDLPEPSPIYAASKLTGRLSQNVSVGTLSALTGQNGVDVELDSGNGRRESRLIEPLTAYNVVRLKRDIGNNAHVGLLMTGTTRAEDASRYVAKEGDATRVVCPNQVAPDGTAQSIYVPRGERCFHDAYVVGLDARFRRGDWVSAGQVIATAIEHGPTRMLLDGTQIKSGDVAPASDFYIAKEGGKHVTTSAWFGNAARKVDFNDLGFMWRQNVRYAGGGVDFRTLEPWGKTLETHQIIEASGSDNLSGLRLARDADAAIGWKFANFWEARASVGVRSQRFDDREVGDGTALERDASWWGRGRIISDPRAPVSFNVAAQYTAVRTGYVLTADGIATWRVLPQLDVELSPQVTFSDGENRYAIDSIDTHEHLYGPLSGNNVSTTLRATYTFLPRLSLQAYAQGFIANGHYGALRKAANGGRSTVYLSDLTALPGPASNPDFQQGAMNVNTSIRWEYRLGSVIALVYARTQYPKVPLSDTDEGRLTLRSIAAASAVDYLYLKLSYFWG